MRDREFSPANIEVGTFFFFIANPNGDGWTIFSIDPNAGIDRAVPWLLLARDYKMATVGGWYMYQLLGPGPTVIWHTGSLGWIRRIVTE